MCYAGDVCYLGLCFFKLGASDPRFFGFAEFLSAMALMVLVWTLADERYKFRTKTAPLPLRGMAFSVVLAVGVLTLLTDVWRAQEWLVLRWGIVTPQIWQGVLAALLLVTFFVWTWFAFVKPASFGRTNYKRFGNALYATVLRGNSLELAVVADELADSMNALVMHAPTSPEVNGANRGLSSMSPLQGYANDILFMLADPRLVRAIVDSSPRTALRLFRAMALGRRPAALQTFASNFVGEAIQNKRSFLYHEVEGYETGLIGYHKPLTTAMFSSFAIVEELDLLDVHYELPRRWDSEQVEAYSRLVLLAVKSYVAEGSVSEVGSSGLASAFERITHCNMGIYKLDGVDSPEWDNDLIAKLSASVKFVGKAVVLMESRPVPGNVKLRDKGHGPRTLHDVVSKAIYQLLFFAASVRSPRNTCWWVQHNTVWGDLFNFGQLDGPSGKVIKHKVRRLIFNDVTKMTTFPNYKGAKFIGLCLNLMGHRLHDRNGAYDKDTVALHRQVLDWLRVHYASLHRTRPDVAEHCLVAGMTFDAVRKRILIENAGPLGDKRPRYVYLQVR